MSRIALAALDAGFARYQAEVNQAVALLSTAPPPAESGAGRELVLERTEARLWRYGTPGPARGALFLIYAFVNRPSMLDLDERRSLIRRLGEQGITAYLVEWREPDAAYPGLDLASCVDRVLPALLAAACAADGAARLPVLGVCQGGSLSLMLAGLHPERVAGLVTLVTPVDFKTAEDQLSRFAQGLALGSLAGPVPAALLDHLFLCLKPFELRVGKYLHAHRLAGQPEALAGFLRMEQWIFGGPRQSPALLREFVAACYQDNALVAGDLSIAGKPVSLAEIRVPVLNIYASADHLVPPAASQALGPALGTADYEEFVFPGGHVGVFVSQRAQGAIAARIAAWLAQRELLTGAG